MTHRNAGRPRTGTATATISTPHTGSQPSARGQRCAPAASSAGSPPAMITTHAPPDKPRNQPWRSFDQPP